ncbi:hydrolase [Sphingomonas oleivorans]|uniref:Hydrolase n=1 Tax=Sphingomonas oleivorans TaxID=1735121 RepID=A0A2T5FZ69_9SPHN|nr:amidohydrolase [Sphingomonas oleivorans]PTQ11889.1 hydrolase [Sphingomonas oleivorans]
MSRSSAWILAATLIFGIPAPAFAERVDMLLFNGKVLTVDQNFSVQSAVAVKDGRIIAVGGPEIAKRFEAHKRIDLKGRTLMPGFIDTHLHVIGSSKRDIKAAEARSIEELKAMVAAKARELGPGEWIAGYGWDEALMKEHRNPTRADLDSAAPDNPVILLRAGAHSSVANSEAFRRANIGPQTPNPEGGLIERDAKNVPSGIIRERSDLITRLVPRGTPEEMRPSYIAALKGFLTFGITSFMEAHSSIDDEPVGKGGIAGTARRHSFKQFKSIYDEMGQDLPRATLYISYPGAERLKAFPYRTGFGDDRLKLGPIGENPYDGGFTGPTALTKEDYKGQPGFRGATDMDVAQLREMIATSAALGWQLGIHAIGDAAIETVAQIYRDTLLQGPKADHRWFLSHFTMIPSAETMNMMARDGIWAAAQPNFLYNLAGRYRATLDGYRLDHINPLASVQQHKVRVALGSDNLPVGPMVGIYAATTRKVPDGSMIGVEEAISRQEAIRLYTREAAYLSWDEDKKGSIEPGKLADMIVLDHDPLTVPDEDLLKTKVDLTIIGGRIVYDRAAASGQP